MSTQLASGVYRQYCDVTGPNGSARVERVEDADPKRERYQVSGWTCWTHEPPDDMPEGHLDGGWERAISIAEHLTQGRADV